MKKSYNIVPAVNGFVVYSVKDEPYRSDMYVQDTWEDVLEFLGHNELLAEMNNPA